MECKVCDEMTDLYLKENPEKKGKVLCESCYEKSKEYIVYMNLHYQPERSKREDVSCFVYRSEKYEGPIAIDCKPSKECDEYHKNSVIQINLRCGALNSMET